MILYSSFFIEKILHSSFFTLHLKKILPSSFFIIKLIMESTSKEEMLLRLVEHPEQLTDEEKQRLLSDDECREMYDMMVETRQSSD